MARRGNAGLRGGEFGQGDLIVAGALSDTDERLAVDRDPPVAPFLLAAQPRRCKADDGG
jgi:hypothetical protein